MCITLETVWSFKMTVTCITQYRIYIVTQCVKDGGEYGKPRGNPCFITHFRLLTKYFRHVIMHVIGCTSFHCCGRTHSGYLRVVYFDSPYRLSKAMSYMDGLVKKAIEMHLHSNSFSRQEGFTLNRAGHPIMKSLTQRKETRKEKQDWVQQSVDYPLTLLVHILPQALPWYCCLFLTAWVSSHSNTLMMMMMVVVVMMTMMIEVVCETLALLNNLMWQ